ncbi:MAG: hypothetical protein ACLR4Z_01555 [Butyricicoccaceae bacterium]
MRDAFRAFAVLKDDGPMEGSQVQDNDMIFCIQFSPVLSEHPNSGVRMMEAGGVLRLKVDKIIVGEVG